MLSGCLREVLLYLQVIEKPKQKDFLSKNALFVLSACGSEQ